MTWEVTVLLCVVLVCLHSVALKGLNVYADAQSRKKNPSLDDEQLKEFKKLADEVKKMHSETQLAKSLRTIR